MRRARETVRACHRALKAASVEAAAAQWQSIFGELWPTADLVKAAAREEAATVQPGLTTIASQGFAVGGMSRTLPTQATRYHGDE